MVEKVEAELKKKKGGKGLSVLSGKDLFQYNRELFVDDDEADDQQYDRQSDAEEDEDENGDESEGVQGSGAGGQATAAGTEGNNGAAEEPSLAAAEQAAEVEAVTSLESRFVGT